MVDNDPQHAQAALRACGVGGTVTRVEHLRGQSHSSWRVERLDAAPVVLRIEPERGILPPYDLPAEARLLRQLAGAGLPVPSVLGDCADLGLPGQASRGGLVVEWVEGALLNERRMDAEAAEVYGETLWRIHTLDWRSAGIALPPPDDSGPAMREREEIARRLRSFGVSELPHIRRLRLALEGRVPDSPPAQLVHGDINFGNFILAPQADSTGTPRLAAVLDWEQSHLGDPLSDWGRLAAEDLLGNLDLSDGARQVIADTVERYQRSGGDLHYWTLHQLYKHASATGALMVLRGWEREPIAKMYAEPSERLLSR